MFYQIMHALNIDFALDLNFFITPISYFPMYFTLFAICYSFTSIRSDTNSCVFGNRQTEPCHVAFFVGMISKLICPLNSFNPCTAVPTSTAL